ncbi:MAG: response regulator transcription factor [Saprospiraceae bacterium]|nr:response regulator transcription factor [Saprospiraceae bacterium]
MITKIPLLILLCLFCHRPVQAATSEDKELQVVLRQIGHRLLLSSGDSTSRVLPVKILQDHTFEISFEKQIHVTADSLYKIVETELSKAGFWDFVAELKECTTQEVFLSFIISRSRDTVTPCGGRNLPVGCYKVEITILKKSNMMWMVWIFLPIILGSLAIYKFIQSKKSKTELPTSNDIWSLGGYQLALTEKKLIHPEKSEILTDKEFRLLTLLMESKDIVQSRDFLMKEIWASGGLIVVGKNLDVLVSKIRKKLSLDDRIKITSVHGVGYKLEISE